MWVGSRYLCMQSNRSPFFCCTFYPISDTQYAAQWDANKHFEVGIYDKHCFQRYICSTDKQTINCNLLLSLSWYLWSRGRVCTPSIIWLNQLNSVFFPALPHTRTYLTICHHSHRLSSPPSAWAAIMTLIARALTFSSERLACAASCLESHLRSRLRSICL